MEDETNMEALKEHIANLGEKLDRIIGHVGYRQLPDYVEDITLSSQYQGPVKLRGYRYLYLLVSADAVTAMGSSNVLTLDIGGGVTYLQQLKPGWNVVDAPREFRYRVNGLTGAPPALLLHSNDLKAMDGVVSYSGGGVGGSSSNPSYTKLTGSLMPQTLSPAPAPLAASATYTSTTLSLGVYDKIVGSVFADQTGTLDVNQSYDGTHWDVQSSITVSASTPTGFNISVVAPYAQLVYTNGATAQTVFRLNVGGKTL